MAAMNYKVGTLRGANAVDAQPQRIESANGQRWACGRNVKRAEANRTYSVVEVWTLKHRKDGKAVTVETGRSRADAEEWLIP